MRHYKIVENNYIVALGMDTGGIELTPEEYAEIESLIANKPKAPDGYGYHLCTDLTWELYELPPEEQEEEEATSEDYQAALAKLGVSV